MTNLGSMAPDFNAGDEEPATGGEFEALPAGEYEVVIVESTEKVTKAGTGKYLELQMQVLRPAKHDGRFVWDRLNLINPSEKAVEIARGTLSAICRAVGVLTPKDSAELHNRPLVARVTRRDYEGATRNEVKSYRKSAVAELEAAVQETKAETADDIPF